MSYTIRAANSRKKYFVAKFNNADVDFSRFARPVQMTRDLPREDEAEPHRTRRLNPERIKKLPWVIEDADNQYSFIGTVEGGQSSNYVLLIHQPQANEFRVMPTADWYNFRIKRPNKSTLTTEEAEAKLISARKQQTERMSRVKLGADSKKERDDEEDRTAGNDSGDDSFSAFGRFDSDEEKDKKKKRKSGKKKGDNDNEEEEEPDVDEKASREDLDFQDNPSDDEEESVPVEENNTNKPSNNDENSDTERKLSADGKQMQQLISKTRNAEKEDGEGPEDPDNPFASDSDKEDFKLNDFVPEYAQKQKPKPKAEIKEDEEVTAPPENSTLSSLLSVAPDKVKKESKGKKRKTEGKHESSKKPKKEKVSETSSSTAHPPVAPPKEEDLGEVTEAELKAFLIQRGRISAKKLIKIFKSRFRDDDEKKNRFLKLFQKVAKLEEDGSGSKLFTIKEEYRYN